MIGILLGAVFGGLQFWLLTLAVASVTAGRVRVLPMVLQFLCPFAGLLLCAFFVRAQLIGCAVAITVILIGGSVIHFARVRKSDGGKNKKV